MLRRICRPMTICRSDLPLGMSPLKGDHTRGVPGISVISIFNVQSSICPLRMANAPPLGGGGERFSIFNLQSSIFNLQSLIFNFQSSIFNFQSSIRPLRMANAPPLGGGGRGFQSSIFNLQSSIFHVRPSTTQFTARRRRGPSPRHRGPTSHLSLLHAR